MTSYGLDMPWAWILDGQLVQARKDHHADSVVKAQRDMDA
jgi:hypothetical protein